MEENEGIDGGKVGNRRREDSERNDGGKKVRKVTMEESEGIK